ncbi:MAG: DUF2326 domain-containing protein [Atopobiaceae bacterium]|nr:DUF2326 domain-containing protein [Atopobiaceae bacterium]
MLVELWCDKFRDGDRERDHIVFHQGLNAVIGSDDARNSIGKTTTLLAIDFAFGGNDYVNLNSDVTDNIGDHTIRFAFEFDGVTYRFSRFTGTPRTVCPCDEAYHMQDEWAIDRYRNWLLEQYGMASLGGTFRGLVSGFFRIYGRNNSDPVKPLKSHEGEGDGDGITRLLELYRAHGVIADLQASLEDAENRRKALFGAEKYHYVRAATSKTEVKQNQKRMDELEHDLVELEAQSSDGIAELDAVVAEQVADIRRRVSNLHRQRTRLNAKLHLIEDDERVETVTLTHDFTALQEFFPGIDVKSLEEIENFHRQLSRVLSQERRESRAAIQKEISELDAAITELEVEKRSIDTTPQVSTAILRRYAAVAQERDGLARANDAYEEMRKASNLVKLRKTELVSRTGGLLAEVQAKINQRLEELNTIACGPDRTAPAISLETPKRYSYSIPQDVGTGSQTRGMFLFDLVMLEQTPLPAIVHDTHDIKQVEDSTMLNLLELYAQSDKQVFVAVDKESSFAGHDVPRVLEDNAVLRLSAGHELFGRSWNRKNQQDDISPETSPVQDEEGGNNEGMAGQQDRLF